MPLKADRRASRLRYQLIWHALGLFVLLALPLLKFKVPWWELAPRDLKLFGVLLAGYVVSALGSLLFIRSHGFNAALRALCLTVVVFSVISMALLLSQHKLSRFLLISMVTATLLLVPGSRSSLPAGRAMMLMLGGTLAVILAFATYRVTVARPAPLRSAESFIKTAFYPLQLVSHAGVVPKPATRGGGLDRLGDRVLLGAGDGMLYLLTPAGNDLKVQKLPTQVPLNREEFAAAFGGSAVAPERSADYSEAGPPRVQTWRFRVADVIARVDEDSLRILASHHFWKADEQCFVVRVSVLDASMQALQRSIEQGQWRTLYESAPCIALTGPNRKLGKNPFKGEEIGGRMALLDAATLLLTLGDQGFSGIESRQAFAQDPQVAYGKTVRIDLRSGASEIFTLGHRNPQGLLVAQDGRVWSTEHASQGGDELNLLSKDRDYGWPRVTYGTDYASFTWPLSQQQGHHDGFSLPVHAWVPSVGVSNVIQLQGDRFPIWRGDLLMGSLATRSLYRIVLDGDRAVLVEPVPIGQRIRDLLELDDGRIMLWTDDAVIATLAPASGSSGALLFAQFCSGCHLTIDGMSHRLGPDLYRIVDRKVAAAAQYADYSGALKAFGGTWSGARLDAFLRDPQATVPGTTMAFAGIGDEQQRAQVIEYLRSFRSAADR